MIANMVLLLRPRVRNSHLVPMDNTHSMELAQILALRMALSPAHLRQPPVKLNRLPPTDSSLNMETPLILDHNMGASLVVRRQMLANTSHRRRNSITNTQHHYLQAG
jgi:hypothetical protein